MKYGVHAGLWMARWTDDIEPILRIVADQGFDGVEISLLGMTDEKAAALGRLIRDYGLQVTCSDGLSRAADITSEDPDIRAAGVAHLRWAIRTVATLGGDGLAGVVYAPWGVFDHARKARRRDLSAEMLALVDADLREHGVRLGIEAINRFETDLVNTALEAVTLAQATGSDRIGVLLDTFHLNIEEKDIIAAIGIGGDRLFHFHVSDNDRGVPGSGHVPWSSVREGLRAVGYGGWIVAEMFVRSGTPAGGDLNIWRDIEPDATGAASAALTFMRGHFG
jgi:D-psicose/D-tagatose/L-ribulose 3-epimerase